MGASSLLDNGEITEVYYAFGNFKSDQRRKFVKAPFDLVSLGDAQYVMPVSIGSTAREMDTLISADPTSVEYYLGRKDFGCVNLTPQIVGEHELGDGADTWKGVHRFGFI